MKYIKKIYIYIHINDKKNQRYIVGKKKVYDLQRAVCQVSEKLPELGNNREAMGERKPYIGEATRHQYSPLLLRGIRTQAYLHLERQ